MSNLKDPGTRGSRQWCRIIITTRQNLEFDLLTTTRKIMRAWCRAERLTRVWSARHAPHRRGEARLEVTRVPIAFHRHIIQCGKRGGEEYAPWVKGGGGARTESGTRKTGACRKNIMKTMGTAQIKSRRNRRRGGGEILC